MLHKPALAVSAELNVPGTCCSHTGEGCRGEQWGSVVPVLSTSPCSHPLPFALDGGSHPQHPATIPGCLFLFNTFFFACCRRAKVNFSSGCPNVCICRPHVALHLLLLSPELSSAVRSWYFISGHWSVTITSSDRDVQEHFPVANTSSLLSASCR